MPWRPDYVTREFDRLVKVYGLPRITLHGLRHTSGSVKVAEGESTEVVSKGLRHANSTFTSQRYLHRVRHAGKRAANTGMSAVARHRKTG